MTSHLASTVRSRWQRALTLVEVTLAIGVVAVALLPVLGLLCLALTAQAEARIETRATLIAGSIAADLRAGAGTGQRIAIRVAATDNPTRDFIYPDLESIGSSADFHLLYLPDGRPACMVDAMAFAEGLSASGRVTADSPAADCMVRIRLIHDPPETSISPQPCSPAAPIYQIEISVQHPAILPQRSRTKNTFFTRLHLTNQRGTHSPGI